MIWNLIFVAVPAVPVLVGALTTSSDIAYSTTTQLAPDMISASIPTIIGIMIPVVITAVLIAIVVIIIVCIRRKRHKEEIEFEKNRYILFLIGVL